MHSPKKEKGTITTFNLVVMTYFWTCGAPLGIESAVGAGGAFLVITTIFIVSLLWALPQAFMSLELSLMMDVNGSNILWVQRAFGDFLGFVSAQCYLVSSLSTMALLMILFVEYLPEEFVGFPNLLIRGGFVVMVIMVNIRGVHYVSKMSFILLFFIVSPFLAEVVVMIVMGRSVRYEVLWEVPDYGEVDWGVLVSTCVWAFGGFDTVGAVAGEVKGGKNTFFWGVIGAFPLVLLNYLVPIVVSYLVDPNWHQWNTGHFGRVVYNEFPPWLGYWITISSTLANFAQCSTGMAPISWVIHTMASREEGERYLPVFLSWSPWRNIPLLALIFCGLFMLLLSLLPFNILVQIYLILRIFNLLFEYAALFWLRYKEPNTHRPYTIPGGKLGVFLLSLPTVIIAICALSFSEPGVLFVGSGIIFVIVFSYPLTWQKTSMGSFHQNKQHTFSTTTGCFILQT